MFRTAELGRKLSKEEFHEAAPAVRSGLLQAQYELRNADFPVILVFAGVDKAGKSETVNLLNAWMDPRWLITRAYGAPSDEMVERPEFWRYWRDLPPHGRIGLFLSCWYSRPVLERVHGHSTLADFDDELERIVAFERCLADDGALILKFWLHLGKEAQKERLKGLEADPLTRWRVTQMDWDHWHLYDEFIAAAERVIMRTSTHQAPWRIVEGYDKRYRAVAVGSAILDGLRAHLHQREVHRRVQTEVEAGMPSPAPVAAAVETAATVVPLVRLTVLSRLDMTQSIEKKAYKQRLEAGAGQLNLACRKAKELGVSTLLVFEGWDAAGKGGAIRRVTEALDARDYSVVPIAAPTDEERQHHYLWRFWRHLSRAGRVTIFDRSWYGRVLVERVEGFAKKAEWQRAYAEINEFEEQLVEHGIVLCKFWLHITKDEQLRRFKERETIAFKRWKLTEEDWRNREKWDLYEMAINDMVERTSTMLAPWTLIEANDKRFARIKVLETVVNAVQAGIDRAEATAAAELTKRRKGRAG
jgi:polyphosphate:AMP phosphotransferase